MPPRRGAPLLDLIAPVALVGPNDVDVATGRKGGNCLWSSKRLEEFETADTAKADELAGAELAAFLFEDDHRLRDRIATVKPRNDVVDFFDGLCDVAIILGRVAAAERLKGLEALRLLFRHDMDRDRSLEHLFHLLLPCVATANRPLARARQTRGLRRIVRR